VGHLLASGWTDVANVAGGISTWERIRPSPRIRAAGRETARRLTPNGAAAGDPARVGCARLSRGAAGTAPPSPGPSACGRTPSRRAGAG
jgi:hypothetical protein